MSTNPQDRKTPRVANQPRASRPTAASVDAKVKTLAERNQADHDSMFARLNGQDRSIKLIGKKHDRLARLVAQLGERVATDYDRSVTDHDRLVNDITPRLIRLEELADKVGLSSAAAIVGFTPDEVKEILQIQSDDELDNSMLITGMVETLRHHGVVLETHTEELAAQRRELDDHGQQLGTVHTRLDAIDGDEGQLNTLRNRVEHELAQQTLFVQRVVNENQRNVFQRITESFRISHRPTLGGGIAAFAVFIITWVLVWWLGNDTVNGKVFGMGANAHKQLGTYSSKYHFGWIGFFAGLFLGLIVLILSMLSNGRLVHEQTTEVQETTGNANAGHNAAPQPPAAPAQPQNPPAQNNAPVAARTEPIPAARPSAPQAAAHS